MCNFTHSVSFYTQFAPFCREVIFVRNLRCFVARRFSSQIYALLSVKFSDLKSVSVKKVTNMRYEQEVKSCTFNVGKHGPKASSINGSFFTVTCVISGKNEELNVVVILFGFTCQPQNLQKRLSHLCPRPSFSSSSQSGPGFRALQ